VDVERRLHAYLTLLLLLLQLAAIFVSFGRLEARVSTLENQMQEMIRLHMKQ